MAIHKTITAMLVRSLTALIVSLTMLPTQLYAASMGDYCVMPPYVKTDVQPNIMIMMDNAVDMGAPAYTLPYNINTTYSGYFKPGLKYTYASNRWEPSSTGIYSGNLLNWATTSKYDLLQTILVGGISTSRQSNVNTLVSKSNSWQKTLTYTDSLGLPRKCIFKVNNANVEITELIVNECGYLDTPIAYPIPTDPIVSFLELDSRYAAQQRQNIYKASSRTEQAGKTPGYWSIILSAVMDFLVPSAEAAPQLRISGGPSSLTDGTECTAGYTVTLSASGGTASGYTWSWVSRSTSTVTPPGLTLATSGTNIPNATDDTDTTISGTPTTSGTHYFTVTVTDSGGNTDSKDYSITVNAVTFAVTTNSITAGTKDLAYSNSADLSATAGVCTPYTWSISAGSLPTGLTLSAAGVISGTPTASGTSAFTVRVTNAPGRSATKDLTLTINETALLAITTGSSLPDATKNVFYTTTLTGVNGTVPYNSWAISAGSLPPGLSLADNGGDKTTATISGTPSPVGALPQTYTFTVRLQDKGPLQTVTKTFTLIVNAASARTTGNLDVKVCIGNYTYNCNTALPSPPSPSTDPWPVNSGCSESDKTRCVLKSGLIDEFWDEARFGVMDFRKSANVHAVPEMLNCIEQSPAATPDSNYLTAIENAVAIDPVTTLVTGEHYAVNYFQTATGNCNPYTNATTCTKNFILLLTGGAGADNPPNPDAGPPTLTDSQFTTGVPASCTSASLSSLAKNACYGFNHADLRSDVSGRQYVGTYIVNTMGVLSESTYTNSNNAPGSNTGNILKQAALKGGGNYYEVTDASTLKAQLEQALQDIIKRAAAGTAASVLASGEGSGANLIQAVFYPRRKFEDTEISWIGRLTNFWYYVDPFFAASSIREDDGDKILDLVTEPTGTHADYITSLYFSGEATMATRWRDTDGNGLVDGAALSPDIEFENVGSLWEAGKLLWSREISSTPTRTIYTSVTGTTFTSFSTANKTVLRSYLQAASDEESEAVIRYVHGEDTPFSPAIAGFAPSYRPRSVTISGQGPYTWKLGDILNSTPKISTWMPLNNYHHAKIYGDTTYGELDKDPSPGDAADSTHYITSSGYKSRGMVFAGANDGMLHAFKLGSLELNWAGRTQFQKARLTGSELGKEMWAFIPKNALPYLKYTADPAYCHIYSVDLTPFLFDASIHKPAACGASDPAADCVRTAESWRTILIGGMRYGGACRKQGVACNSGSDCVNTPTVDPGDTSKGLGYSSYFALDITDQDNPVLLWEFSDPELGFTTTGPSVVRINATGDTTKSKNGHWFVVFGSGPTGPIDTNDQQFMGRSDQNLRLFVLDLTTGTRLRTIDTGITNAFAGSLFSSTLDTDLDYQDDVIYVPYVKLAGTTWTDGGVGRLSTKENLSPSNWVWSTVRDGIGPVTSAVSKLVSRHTQKLWLFFGTGRYFYEKANDTDDGASQRSIYGVKDPCYTSSGFQANCTSSVSGSLDDVTNNASANPEDIDPGWLINLDRDSVPDVTFRAERVITDPLAATTGLVFFTTYKPYRDQCALGGKTYIWAVKYNTGGAAGTLLQGKALVQVSTGSIEQINLADAFTQAGGRKTAGMEGVPPTMQGLSVMSQPRPVKRVLHRRER